MAAFIFPSILTNCPVPAEEKHPLQHNVATTMLHSRGLLPEEKPELQRFLEQRRLEQHREREQALKPLSDLEQELCKRRQKLMAYEQEELRRREDLEKMPELVRMRNNLRHISISGC
ncbi:protein FAM107B-like isoform X1 [Myxocyprinus asiaticus]|uniref:protein FAM107B-like isoform X1 n=1 Tax=Myxocyprinus asiaticus TaxID=70543 RepID=UPI0022235D76|nr:protein FAM107B-like isoform X1 [Myxocyprinus asiaticus]